MSLPGQSFAPLGSCQPDMILGVEFHVQEEASPSKAHSTSHSRKREGIPCSILKSPLALPNSKCRKSLDFAILFHPSALLGFFLSKIILSAN